MLLQEQTLTHRYINMIKSRKGSYIVEAAILYPIIVVITVMMFVIFIFFFMNTTKSYMMAHTCRMEAGYRSGTVIYDRNEKILENDFELNIYNDILMRKVRAENRETLKNNIIYKYEHENKYSIEHSIINEAELIWLLKVIKN